jgi:hypothetical protein
MDACLTSPPEALALLKRLTSLLNVDVECAKQLVEVADAAWVGEIVARRPCPADAESCRLTMLACITLSESHSLPAYDHQSAVWRVRAITRAAACNWMDGLMALVMAEALRLQGIANQDRRPDEEGYRVLPEAFAILEELRPYIGPEGSAEDAYRPSPRFTGRQYFEKRGFLFLAAKNWDEARVAFEQALTYVSGDPRGNVKVRLQLAAVEYLATEPVAASVASEPTVELAKEAREIPQIELADVADKNAARMAAGSRDLLPYELI